MQNWRIWCSVEHHGFAKREGTGTRRVVNWAQVFYAISDCRDLSRYHGLVKTPIPISKVKYGSYPSKNIPYFIHLLSLHVFYRISGRTLPISGLALPVVLEFIHGRAAWVIYNLPRDLPSVDVQKSVKWDLLFDMYKAKIATLIYKIFHRITPSCLERLIQRRKNKYDLCHHYRVSVSCFETYNMKNSISYRGSHAWNLLDPSVADTTAYAKMALNSQALKNLNFSAGSPLTMNMFNDSDFVFYWLIINIIILIHLYFSDNTRIEYFFYFLGIDFLISIMYFH